MFQLLSIHRYNRFQRYLLLVLPRLHHYYDGMDLYDKHAQDILDKQFLKIKDMRFCKLLHWFRKRPCQRCYKLLGDLDLNLKNS